ncbi:DUF4915 domain-containing protein [Nostoc sp. 2RC]|uniref:DUF4915 domain-containing protein n=1 Tax=Nostoc sp. 2RC TaxID=2485484 RepID=UPI001627145B|nr:DUF4915 domain-containing protein [Nostoc sp. 2RC]MBC1242130.1 DUF4915 domain-containing protein [Nostoc sp. 2RC]
MGDFLPDSDSISSSNLPKLKINCSPGLAGWLQTQGISLAFTTYQSNWLFFISCNQQGRIAASDRLFDKPMGMYAVNNSIYTSTRYQIWRFENLLTTKETYQQSLDAKRLRKLPSGKFGSTEDEGENSPYPIPHISAALSTSAPCPWVERKAYAIASASASASPCETLRERRRSANA